MRVIRTLASYLYLFSAMIYGYPFLKRLEKQRQTLGDAAVQEKIYRRTRRIAKRLLKCAGCTIQVQGAEPRPEEGPVLYVANHQSYMDIPILVAVLEHPVGFVAKENLRKIPFFGQWLDSLRCVMIARGDSRRALAAILETAKLLQAGHSMVLYPEGMRSRDGKLGEFKAGSLKAAQRGKARIVPVAVKGARDVMPRGSFWMYARPVTVTLLPELDAETVQSTDTKTLAEQLRTQIAQALGQAPAAGDEASEHG